MLKREKLSTTLKNIGRNASQNPSTAESAASLKIKQVSASNNPSFLALLESSEHGLTTAEVRNRRLTYGLNEVTHEKAPKWYIQFFEAFLNPFIGVLFVLAIISLITDVIIQKGDDKDYTTVIVISIMVLLSAMLRFVQEFRSNKAAEKLKAMVNTTATVLRNGEEKEEIDIKRL